MSALMQEMTYRLAELSGENDRLGRQLVAFYESKDVLHTAIKRTHECGYHEGRLVVIRWRRGGSAVRAPLFSRLDRLHQQWAPIVNEKRIVSAQQRALRTEIKKEAEREAREARREARA